MFSMSTILPILKPSQGYMQEVPKIQFSNTGSENYDKASWCTHPPKSGTLTLIIIYKWKYKKNIYARALFRDFPAPSSLDS